MKGTLRLFYWDSKGEDVLINGYRLNLYHLCNCCLIVPNFHSKMDCWFEEPPDQSSSFICSTYFRSMRTAILDNICDIVHCSSSAAVLEYSPYRSEIVGHLSWIEWNEFHLTPPVCPKEISPKIVILSTGWLIDFSMVKTCDKERFYLGLNPKAPDCKQSKQPWEERMVQIPISSISECSNRIKKSFNSQYIHDFVRFIDSSFQNIRKNDHPAFTAFVIPT